MKTYIEYFLAFVSFILILCLFFYPLYFTSNEFKEEPNIVISIIIFFSSITVCSIITFFIMRLLKKINFSFLNSYSNAFEFFIFIVNIIIFLNFLTLAYSLEFHKEREITDVIKEVEEVSSEGEFTENDFQPVE